MLLLPAALHAGHPVSCQDLSMHVIMYVKVVLGCGSFMDHLR